MANLSPLELERLKSLLSGKALTMGEKISTLDVLRSRFPDFFSNLTSNLTKENLNDNIFLIKYLTNPSNKNKIKNALRDELSLSFAQQIELTKALEEKPIVTGEAGEEADTQMAPAEQGAPAQTPVGETAGTMGLPGLPAAPSISSPLPRRIFITEQTTPPIAGKAGGTGQGTAATNKINRFPQSPSFLKTFGSNAQIFTKRNLGRLGRGISGAIKTGLETANPFLGRLGNGLVSGLTNIANPGSTGGAGSRSIFGKFGRFGRGSRTSSVVKSAKKRTGLLFLIGILGFMMLVGGLAITGSNQTGTVITGTPTGSSDINSCKFTRAGVADSYESNLLLSYINEASSLTGIPSAILAAFIRVENPSVTRMSDEQIRSYASNCAVSPTGALGVMQIQPPGTTSLRGDPASCDDCIDAGAKLAGKTVSAMTREDYCDPKTSIIVGSGWILKKMDKLGYKNTGKWDPAWTDDRRAIDALVNTYYGCLQYGGSSDCTGPYNYGEDVYYGAQNCKTTIPTQGNVGIGQPGISGLVSAASQFVSLLSKGTDGLFNVKSDEPGFYYWCTALIIDAYNKVGLSGLSRNAHLGVLNMKAFFTNTQGYRLLPPNTAVEQLRVGDVIFFEGSGGQHVSLINSFDISPSGNGAIRTYDANNVVTEDQVFVQNHQAISAQTTSRIYSITGFGQAINQ